MQRGSTADQVKASHETTLADLGGEGEASLDRIAGPWQVYQLKKGHRFSLDDLVTAWRASLAKPDASRLLDIGCGICSVGLSTLYKCRPSATLVGIEAQTVSYELACRSVAHNGLGDRVRILHGDLRDEGMLEAGATFDLITGSPPYCPPDKALQSPVAQRACCRLELRGDVYDYCRAARRWLAPDGRFCFVMAAQDARTEDAAKAAGLAVVERYDYTFKEGREPHICTLVCARSEDVAAGATTARGGMLVRGADGGFTKAHTDFKEYLLEVSGAELARARRAEGGAGAEARLRPAARPRRKHEKVSSPRRGRGAGAPQ